MIIGEGCVGWRTSTTSSVGEGWVSGAKRSSRIHGMVIGEEWVELHLQVAYS